MTIPIVVGHRRHLQVDPGVRPSTDLQTTHRVDDLRDALLEELPKRFLRLVVFFFWGGGVKKMESFCFKKSLVPILGSLLMFSFCLFL